MDAVPRISRAQSLDVLSSMANIAGYRAVVEAAHVFGRFFTGQVTAAGKVPPARVLVAGAGVAGLSAIGTAGSLGAIVEATDPRPEVADQVRSLGGEYLAVAAPDVEVSATGYAKEMSEDYNARAEALYAARLPETDIVITTALIPGRPAPTLITAEMVASMKAGSVIVDMAAANGGNVEGTVKDRRRHDGHRGDHHRLHRPGGAAPGAGVAALWHQRGQPDEADDTGQGRTADPGLRRRRPALHDRGPQRGADLAAPARPGLRSATHADQRPGAGEGVRRQEADSRLAGGTRSQGPAPRRCSWLGALAPPGLLGHLTVFALAIVIGYYVIGHVHHALHTPLMSVTNAISGIIVVGALLQIGHGGATNGDVITALAFRRHPARQHQRLRRLRRHPSDARHVLPKLTPCARILELTNEHRDCRAGGLHRRGPAVHPGPGRVVPPRDRQGPATPSASAAWWSPWQPRSPWPSTGTSPAPSWR